MGCVPSITADGFPGQGILKGKRTSVCFHYDTSKRFNGTIVRDDVEAPFVTIIKLDDGRFVLSTECQHSPTL